MKAMLKLLKPLDYVIILLVFALSFLPNIITFYSVSQATPAINAPAASTAATPDTTTVAIVKIDGKEVDRYELSENAPHTEKTYYPHDGQYNIVERDGKSIRVKEDNSPDQIAVQTGWIYRPGQVSICLPHNLVIEIHGEVQEDELVLPK